MNTLIMQEEFNLHNLWQHSHVISYSYFNKKNKTNILWFDSQRGQYSSIIDRRLAGKR